jgi:hypothetical protein
VAAFREGWFLAGASTEPADRPRAEAAIARMYAAIGASAPRFVWCDSPMTAQLVLCVLGRRRCSRRTALWRSLAPALRDALGEALRISPLGVWLGEALRVSGVCLEDVLWASRKAWRKVTTKDMLPTPRVRALLAASRERPLWGAQKARELLEFALVKELMRSLQVLGILDHRTPSWVQQDADWIELFLFYRDVLGIRYAPPLSERLDWWADLVCACTWWWPYRQVCVVSERPVELHTLGGRRLYNDAGLAVRFRDGWSI